MTSIIPIIPPLMDWCTTRDVATSATIIKASAPSRSDHGARLKNSHHTTVATPHSIPTMTPTNESETGKTSLSGAISGRTYRASTSTIAITRPGHNRSGLRGVGPPVSIGDISVDVLLVDSLRRLDGGWR